MSLSFIVIYRFIQEHVSDISRLPTHVKIDAALVECARQEAENMEMELSTITKQNQATYT